MNRIFVLGNGESRRCINLKHLHQYGKMYGCNAIYRDYPDIDLLVSVDENMISELVREKVYTKTQVCVRKPSKNNGRSKKRGGRGKVPSLHPFLFNIEKMLPKDRGMMSGGVALELAAIELERLGGGEIFLLGFDVFGHVDSQTGKHAVNNIYKGTPNYTSPDSAPVTTVRWCPMTYTVIEEHPSIKFYKMNGPGVCIPSEWLPLPHNLKIITPKQMQDYILSGKYDSSENPQIVVRQAMSPLELASAKLKFRPELSKRGPIAEQQKPKTNVT